MVKKSAAYIPISKGFYAAFDNYHAGDTVKAVNGITQRIRNNDVILTSGANQMTLVGAAALENINAEELSSSDDVYRALASDESAGDTVPPEETSDTTPSDDTDTDSDADSDFDSDTDSDSDAESDSESESDSDSDSDSDSEEDTTPSALDISNDVDSILLTGSEVNDTITNSGDDVTIEGGAGDDEIFNSGERVSIEGGRGNDSISNEGDEVSISGGAGNDQITNAGNSSKIFGGNGNDTIANGQYNSNTISGGKGNDSIINDGGVGIVFVYNEGDGNDFIAGFNATSTLSISGSEYSSLASGDDIIISVDAGAITLSGASNLSEINIDGTEQDLINLTVKNSTRSPLTLGEETENVDAANRTKAIRIIGNYRDNSIIGSSGNDTLDGAAGDDTLTGGKGSDLFVYSGGRDVISDYSRRGSNGKDKISIASDLTFKEYEVAADNVVLTYTDSNGNDQTLTITDSAGKEINFGTTIGIYESAGIFATNGKAVTLAADNEEFEATRNYSKLVTIDGTAADEVEIIGNKKANYIVAGKGNSTLNGGKGKDTLVGGDGDDIFIFENKSGNKIIRSCGDDDKISLGSGAALSEVQIKNNDLVLKVGKNKITIDGGAADNSFAFDDGGEKTYSNGLIMSGNSVSLTTAYSGQEFSLNGTDYKNADASLLKKNLRLIGNSEINSLIGSKGNDTLTAGSGGASLWGGKGNDSLVGGAGIDTFIFRAGEGTDTIFGYDDGDLLQIMDKRGRTAAYSKATFSGSTLTLSIKGGGKLLLEGMSAGAGVNINGAEHTIIGRTLSK